jgi:hypothetical protein
MRDMATSSQTHTKGLLEYMCTTVCVAPQSVDSSVAFFVAKALQLYVWTRSEHTVTVAVIQAAFAALTAGTSEIAPFVYRQFEKVLSDACKRSVASAKGTEAHTEVLEFLAERILQEVIHLCSETPLVGARILPRLLEEMVCRKKLQCFMESPSLT